jgi:hypothetical protein
MKLKMERKLENSAFNTNSDLDQIILSCVGNEEDKYRVIATSVQGIVLFDELFEDTLDAIMSFRYQLDHFLKCGYQEVKTFQDRSPSNFPFSIPGSGGAGNGGTGGYSIQTYTTDTIGATQVWLGTAGGGGTGGSGGASGSASYCSSYTAGNNTNTAVLENPNYLGR